MTITLNPLSGKLLISFSLGFSLFLGFFLFCLECISVSSFCLTFCVCFYELAERPNSPGIERVALCRSACCVDCVSGGFGRLVRAEVGMAWRFWDMCCGHFCGIAGAGVGIGWVCPM